MMPLPRKQLVDESVADWENDPVYRDLKRRFDSGEIGRQAFLDRGFVYMRAELALGPERWKRLAALVEAGEPYTTAAHAIINGGR